jgi:glycosyltransferase involved in cell wall biosynthesis
MPDRATPFVTVVVAAYNAEATLGRCLDCLQALDYPKYEILVVDNASTDGTRALAERDGVTVLDESRPGWPAARNRGWHYSRAPLVANIDADCFAEPDWLSRLVAALGADPAAGCAVGRTKVEPGETLAERYYADMDPFNIEKYIEGTASARGRQCPWGGGNNVLRREVIEAVGGYDACTYTSGADREFHRRFERATPYRTVYVPDAVIWHIARGSCREFFHSSAKYASDMVVNAQHDPALAAYRQGFVRRNLVCILRNAAGLVWRTARWVVRRDTLERVAQPIFWTAQSLGAIYGTLKGSRRLRKAKRRQP